ncbi:MAG TPA: amino acid adenylation domain-containing protein [Longimicrobium sp.]|nr:amino acid adenylation domain-containing protein [Longimicrobium sp.]
MLDANLVDLLRTRAETQPDALAYAYLGDDGAETGRLTWAGLDAEARRIAAGLLAAGARGERVLLLYPQGLPFVAAFYGCLYAGAVAVPATPPRNERSVPRIQAILDDARPRVVLATEAVRDAVRPWFQARGADDVRWLATDAPDDSPAGEWTHPGCTGGSLAFLQYTSGSTALPKGVMVSHANLLHNTALLAQAWDQDAGSVIVSWLPLFHDMGLIGTVLLGLRLGAPCHLLSPATFLQRPFLWLEAVSRTGATLSGGPNFAYELAAERTTPEQRATLDLSRWRAAFNGAEPVRADTLEKFFRAFEPCGLRREALRPGYGLAEGTLVVSAGRAGGPGPHRVVPFAAAALEESRLVAHPAGEPARDLVGCGRVVGDDQRVVIADPETFAPTPPDRIGEIWVAGPSVAHGYWQRPRETAETFGARLATGEGPFLRTGDLGFVHDGELFVAGRAKDVIIVHGRNHYPQDLERSAEASHPALRPGCSAAFAMESAAGERLWIACELERAALRDDPAPVADAVRRAVLADHELQVHGVVLLRTGGITKTTSGKIQRRACREALRAGALSIVHLWSDGTTELPEGSRAAPESASPEPRAAAAPATVLHLDAAVVASLVAHPASHPASDQAADAGESPRAHVLAATGAERRERLADFVTRTVARVARVAPEQVDLARPLAELGMDSLMAVELTHAIERGLELPLASSTILSSPTIDEFCAFLLHQVENPAAPAPSTAAGSAAGPLTEGQRALWFLHQLEPGSAAQNVFAAMKVSGPVDEAALRRAWEGVVRRHPALRTAFRVVDGVPTQEPLDAPVNFERVDASAWSEAELEARVGDEAHAPFDLARGEVLRVRLYAARTPVLLIAMHHAVTDFWSGVVMLRDLAALHARETGAAAEPLPPVEATPADAARHEAALLSGGEGRRLAEFWAAELAGLPALSLPADLPRPALPGEGGACHPFRVDAEGTAAVHALARKLGATPFVTLLAAWQALLSRWSGQTDLAVASPAAGRARAAWEDTVGLFMNPVLLRGDLSGEPTFAQLVERTRVQVARALEHQAFPLARATELVQAERGAAAAGEPAFQAMFVFNRPHRLQDAGLAGIMVGQAGARFEHGGLSLEALPVEERTAVCDVSLWIGESNGELVARLQYATDRFEAETAARMAESFTTLLAAALRTPGAPVAALPALTAEMRRRVLDDWSAGGGLDDAAGTRAAPFAPVVQAFEERAAATPQAVALAWDDERMSYAELNRRANQLAHHLRALGAGTDAVVGLCLERSPELLVGMLGILKAGAAYLPLDPAHPAERLGWMLDDARADLVVTRRRIADELEDGVRTWVRLDADRGAIARRPADDPRAAVHAASLAYVIYTSGSTGRPKGTLIPHAALANHTASAADAYEIGAADRVLQFASPTFDASVEEIFPTLARGAALVLRPERVLGAVTELLGFCAAEEITVLDLPTAYWHQLAAALRDQGLALPACVRVVIIGGERALPDRVEAWTARVPASVALVNTYGPTETTVVATRHRVDAATRGEVPIGRPVRGLTAYVLDRRMEPVPAGVAGELYVGGAGLARGYLGRPALTAEKFVPDPFSAAPGARLYATGDRARHTAGGALEFAGRADGQVKVRGYRVEPGEVESAIAQHPDIRLAVVEAREDAPGQRRLVAYAQAHRDPAPSPREMREFLRELLPDFMVPGAFVFLPALPLTPGGKVDRRALPAPGDAAAPARAWRAPSTAAEQVLAEVWAAVLGRERVGADDNFFELGGDSILAVQALSRAAQAGVKLTPRQLFAHPTLAALAQAAQLEPECGGTPASPSTPAAASATA